MTPLLYIFTHYQQRKRTPAKSPGIFIEQPHVVNDRVTDFIEEQEYEREREHDEGWEPNSSRR